MLVIARRIGEAIRIGPDIEVKFVETGRTRVMVAIAAPRALKIQHKGASDNAQPEPPEKAANETLRQRRVRLASR